MRRTLRIGPNQLVAELFNILLNLIFVSRFGLVAAGITTVAGFVLLFGLQTRSSSSNLGWPFPFDKLLRVLAASLGMVLTIAAASYGMKLLSSGD